MAIGGVAMQQQAAACKRLLAAAAAASAAAGVGVRLPGACVDPQQQPTPQPQPPPPQTIAFGVPDGLAFAVQGIPAADALYPAAAIPITF